MLSWQYYPKSDILPEHLVKVINIFNQNLQFNRFVQINTSQQ